MSMCLVRAWNTEFSERSFAPVLSRHKTDGCWTRKPSSFNKDCNHTNSVAVEANDLYFDLVVDLETTCCFLKDQLIKFPPINTQYPRVDLLSSTLLPQLVYKKPSSIKGLECCEKSRPRLIEPFEVSKNMFAGTPMMCS